MMPLAWFLLFVYDYGVPFSRPLRRKPRWR
jgi:hypothetical protein